MMQLPSSCIQSFLATKRSPNCLTYSFFHSVSSLYEKKPSLPDVSSLPLLPVFPAMKQALLYLHDVRLISFSFSKMKKNLLCSNLSSPFAFLATYAYTYSFSPPFNRHASRKEILTAFIVELPFLCSANIPHRKGRPDNMTLKSSSAIRPPPTRKGDPGCMTQLPHAPPPPRGDQQPQPVILRTGLHQSESVPWLDFHKHLESQTRVCLLDFCFLLLLATVRYQLFAVILIKLYFCKIT